VAEEAWSADDEIPHGRHPRVEFVPVAPMAWFCSRNASRQEQLSPTEI